MNLFLSQLSIRRWADTNDSRWAMPHILRRLIWTTASGVSRIDFPAYESGNRPGFDGVVECSDTDHAWIPFGRSVWEIGTGQDVKSKLDEDFRKRSAIDATPRCDQELSTFVFVTPRRFDKKAEWIKDNSSAGFWQDIRILDAVDLEQWIEAAPPGLRIWLGHLIGDRPQGVDDVETRWKSLCAISEYPLPPTLFLAGRQNSSQRVNEWVNGKPSRLGIECRSPSELIDFYCAYVASLEEVDQTRLAARSVVVLDRDAWLTLRDFTTPAVLIIDPLLDLSREDIVRAVQNGHHVLLATEPSLQGQRGEELERLPQFELRKALEEAGYLPAIAEKWSRASGGSLAVLKNLIAPNDSKNAPIWSTMVSSETVTACLLLGGWDDQEADQNVFSEIAGRDYAACQTELQILASSRDPLLIHASGKWRLISKDYAWTWFESQVSPESLQRFQKLAADILADDDPRFGLPEKDRFLAQVKGHTPRYSGTIKRHVAETLAFLGCFGERLQAASSTNILASVDRIVAETLKNSATWHRWASLGARLPLLAEASPGIFLDVIESDLKSNQPVTVQLLHEAEEPLFGSCNHAGLLWALEGLAWSPRWLSRVAPILLQLSACDKSSSRWSNRPANSLREILLDWLPHTTADLVQRIQVLELLIRRNQDAAWTILLSLLPEPTGGTSDPTHLPYWRDWADSWERGVTRRESYEFTSAVAARLLEMAGIDAQRWMLLFQKIGQFPGSVKDAFLRRAAEFAVADVSDADRRMAADELSKQINRHRYFSNSSWAIPEEILAQFDNILRNLKPRSCVYRHAWLFEQWPDRFFERGGSYQEQQAALDNARRTALGEILAECGYDGIEELIGIVGSPADIGRIVAMMTEDRYLHEIVPECLGSDEAHRAFAGGFVWNRFWNNQWEWVDRVLVLCDDSRSKSQLLTFVKFCPEAWSRASAAGPEVAGNYWQTVRAFNPELEPSEIVTAVEQLIQVRRAWSAIDLLAMALHSKKEMPADVLCRPLELLLNLTAEEASQDRRQSDRYDIQRIIEALQNAKDVDRRRLAHIEWQFIRLLDGHDGHSPTTLRQQLCESPEFFIEVLCLCYLERHRERDGSEAAPDPKRKSMAEHGYRLLHDWNVVPGQRDDGTVCAESLRSWIVKAREMAENVDRIEICDNHIGQLLAKCSFTDDDGAWPCAAIRHVIEEFATKSLRSGFYCGIHNSRGATFRASGGDQERELEGQFRSKADLIRFDSPTVAEVLDSVADSYKREAAWWDDQDRWEER